MEMQQQQQPEVSASLLNTPKRNKCVHCASIKLSLVAENIMKRTDNNSTHVITVDIKANNKYQIKQAVKKLYDIDAEERLVGSYDFPSHSVLAETLKSFIEIQEGGTLEACTEDSRKPLKPSIVCLDWIPYNEVLRVLWFGGRVSILQDKILASAEDAGMCSEEVMNCGGRRHRVPGEDSHVRKLRPELTMKGRHYENRRYLW
ncbi:60S ribosomal protein L23a-like protein [Cricetulus griseus]|nr:60S ribosomal protein L23a-like protein [Cricetulus griseus]